MLRLICTAFLTLTSVRSNSAYRVNKRGALSRSSELGGHEEAFSLRVACVGDSITYGYRGWAPPSPDAYPTVLQRLLGNEYTVTNLGNPGKTVQKSGQDWGNTSAAYWETSEFQKLSNGSWDIVVVQLGTNDAKDEGNGGPPNWKHDQCDNESTWTKCPYWTDFNSLISVIRSLGSPDIFIAVPPPVTKRNFNINATVVNNILPKMIPQIAEANAISTDHVLNMFGALGGNSLGEVPQDGCTAAMSNASGCAFMCDSNYCDNVHPADPGFRTMAAVAANAITLVGPPQRP